MWGAVLFAPANELQKTSERKIITKKRLLSAFLALCMILTLVPAAFAAESSTFADVNSSDWFYSDVQYVSVNNLMNGVGDGKFAPDLTTTRGMIVMIIVWRVLPKLLLIRL